MIEILSWTKKMLNVCFWNKNEKMSQIDLNSDLKEKPDLKSMCFWFLLFGRGLNMPESAEIYPNVGKYFSISVTLWICLNMGETLCTQTSQSSKYAWICLNNAQNMHKLLLSNPWAPNYICLWFWICLNKPWVLNMLWYTWISLTVPGFWICLNQPKYTRMGANMPQFV